MSLLGGYTPKWLGGNPSKVSTVPPAPIHEEGQEAEEGDVMPGEGSKLPFRSGSAGDTETPTHQASVKGGRSTAGPMGGVGGQPKHVRGSSWHPESDFDSRPVPKFLPMYSGTPLINALLRVQPHNVHHGQMIHPLMVVRLGQDKAACWSYSQFLDVFVHPSTLPEVYEQLVVSRNSTYLAHLHSISPPYLEEVDSKDQQGVSDTDDVRSVHTAISVDTGYTSLSTETSTETNVCKPLCRSVVVRLCFATRLKFRGDELTALIGEREAQLVDAKRRRAMEGTEGVALQDIGRLEGMRCGEEEVVSWPVKVEDPEEAEVIVKEGHVVMSDLLRQQMFCRAGCLVRLRHVLETWRADKPPPTNLRPITPILQHFVSHTHCLYSTVYRVTLTDVHTL